MNINRNLAFIVIAVLVAVGIVGSIALRILRPDAEATFINSVMTMLGFVSAALLILLNQSQTDKKLEKTDEKLETIAKQTNGALSGRDEEIKRKSTMLIEAGIHPETGEPITAPIMTRRAYKEKNNA